MKLVDPVSHRDVFLTLEYLASEPYTRFVYESPDSARLLARALFEQGLGEFAPPFGSAALDDNGDVLGMLAFLDGAELARARMDVAIALIRQGLIEDEAVADRISLAATTMFSVEADDLYLARIAVAAEARGRGIGAELLAELERAARARAKRRIVLEVSPMHPEAIRLYMRDGFEIVDERHVEDHAAKRSLTYRHLVKQLT